jgi:hypothetical protein
LEKGKLPERYPNNLEDINVRDPKHNFLSLFLFCSEKGRVKLGYRNRTDQVEETHFSLHEKTFKSSGFSSNVSLVSDFRSTSYHLLLFSEAELWISWFTLPLNCFTFF